MRRHLIIVVLVSSFLSVSRITAQENPSSAVAERLQKLQADFDQWQRALAEIRFEESTLDQRWLTLLDRERSTCLETMKAANQQITAVALEKSEGPRLAQEFLLVDDLIRLSDHLDNLLHLVTFSFGVSPPASNPGSGNQPAAFKWQRELGSMLKAIQPAKDVLRSDVYNRLDAIGQSGPAAVRIPPSPPMQPGSPGQISGHVYRADTGAPLANVIVTVSASPSGNMQSQRTAADGTYQFTGLAPGFYWLSVYRSGFVGQVYGKNETQAVGSCPPSCITLSAAQKLDGIDLRLSAVPNITPMAEDGFAAAFPAKPLRLTFGPGRFSPDGKFFAIAITSQATEGQTQLWLYDMHSHGLTPITDGPERTPLNFGIRDWAWTQDDTLYLTGLLLRHRVGQQAYVEVTTTGVAREIAEVPPQVAATFQEDEALHSSGGFPERTYNDQYIVTSQRLCHGCSDTLSVRQRNGGATRRIAEIDRNFVFDPQRSLVFYSKLRLFDPGSIIIFDLKTWQSQEILLPVMAQSLLDQTPEGTGHLVAYLAAGSCEPDASSEEAESQQLVPGNVKLRREVQPWHVCFVKLP